MLMRASKSLTVIGAAYGIAAKDFGCADGPLALQQSDLSSSLAEAGLHLDWQTIIKARDTFQIGEPILPEVARMCVDLANVVTQSLQQQQSTLVLGGDHSSAIGTWSGVFAGKGQSGPMGLIWVDAHMDSHTPETSETGAIHGMPLAVLLGHGYPELTNIATAGAKLQPENVVIMGIRSYEAGEAKLLEDLNVRVYMMDEIEQRGIDVVMQEAQQIVSKNTLGYGITIDLDGLDPDCAPGVGTPVAGGINGYELCQALKVICNDPRLLAAEITEYNPHHDIENRTQEMVYALIHALYLD